MQRLGHDHHVEARVFEVPEAFVQVLLDDVDAFAQAYADVVGIHVQAVAVDVLTALQMRQQIPFAAAEVEHTGVRVDEVGDDGEVGSQAHGHASSCTRSRKVPRTDT